MITYVNLYIGHENLYIIDHGSRARRNRPLPGGGLIDVARR